MGMGHGDFGVRYAVMWFGLPLTAVVAALVAWRAIRTARLDWRRGGVVVLWIVSPYLLLVLLEGPWFTMFVFRRAVTGEAGGYFWATPSILLGAAVFLTVARQLLVTRRRR